MDCDDVMMALAKGPECYELDSAQEFSAHIGTCSSCAELSEGLFEEAEDEHLGKEMVPIKFGV
ncbi:MAG: hypothetical protein JKY56_00330 [Kofleriaceae bacterium]|nr:hypothetical protein [Kofleriaceae bacterium]